MDEGITVTWAIDTTLERKNNDLLVFITVHIVVAVAVFALSNFDRVQSDVMISTDIRITNDVKLKRVCSLGQGELELDGEVFGDGHTFDDQQLLAGGVSNNEPPVGQLFERVKGSDHRLVGLVVVIDVS